MAPRVINIVEEKEILKFTLQDVNVSLANALRRIILSDIPTLVFRTTPYAQNKAIFEINTSRMNNELIKQRLSCIPIHINDKEFPYKDYILEVDVKNDSEDVVYVTTENFKIKDKSNDKYLSDAQVKKIFPPDKLTGNYIDFIRLRPRLSENLEGEHLKLTCEFDIGTAREDGMFNVVSTCAYGYTPNIVERKNKLADKEKELKAKGLSADEITYQKKDWLLLEGQRYTEKDSFDFIIESVGVFDNFEIAKMACIIMKDKLAKFVENIQTNTSVLITKSKTTMLNSYDILLENESYTLGKVLEYLLYREYFEKKGILNFCGFRKAHPHIDSSIIRIAFKDPIESETTIATYLYDICETAMKTFDLIFKEFRAS